MEEGRWRDELWSTGKGETEWKRQSGWMKGYRKGGRGRRNGKSNVIRCRGFEMRRKE